MSLRYKGGIKSAAGASVAAGAGGTGRWTLQEAIQNISAGTWSGLPTPTVEYLVVAGGGGGSQILGTLYNGAAGGSGIVIIRYADTYPAATSTTGSPTITVAGGYRVYTWTASGSITI